MKIATGGAPADTADIQWHLEVVRHELRPPLGILDLAEGHAEAAGDAQLADALATLGHRLAETLDAYERAVETLDALEATGGSEPRRRAEKLPAEHGLPSVESGRPRF